MDIGRNSFNVTEYANIELWQPLGNLQYVTNKVIFVQLRRNSSTQLTLTTGHAVSVHTEETYRGVNHFSDAIIGACEACL